MKEMKVICQTVTVYIIARGVSLKHVIRGITEPNDTPLNSSAETISTLPGLLKRVRDSVQVLCEELTHLWTIKVSSLSDVAERAELQKAWWKTPQ